jgi:DNA-binding MarR family transcriptional regulator
MSKAVSVLQGRGLVERRDDPADGRRCLVTLTEAGRQALDDGRAERDSFMVQRITSLSADEREVLRRAAEILQKVIAR